MPFGDPAGYLPRVKRARLKQKPVKPGAVGQLKPVLPKKKGPASFKAGLSPSALDLKKTRNARKSY
jgi:hypothetical protein